MGRTRGTTGGAAPAAGEDGDEAAPLNAVQLVGRLAAAAEQRELPSGDVVVTFRLVVDRPPAVRRTSGPRPVTVDTLDCAVWRAADRRRALALEAGDVVAVQGALRRRFWRAGAAAASRCEVEVAVVRRVRRASTAAPSPAPSSSP